MKDENRIVLIAVDEIGPQRCDGCILDYLSCNEVKCSSSQRKDGCKVIFVLEKEVKNEHRWGY